MLELMQSYIQAAFVLPVDSWGLAISCQGSGKSCEVLHILAFPSLCGVLSLQLENKHKFLNSASVALATDDVKGQKNKHKQC